MISITFFDYDQMMIVLSDDGKQSSTVSHPFF